jgi:hypothetical protein
MSTNVTSNSSNAINTSNNANTESVTPNLGQIMNNIRENLNPKTSEERVKMLNNRNEKIAILLAGRKQFEREVGRPMTYSEMQKMFR